ncbi:MAG TPA: hypothetical protein PLL10_08445, partial [Elusimicrobiales bacterium]|nr:hypothetical protein [Elusimicrobiales bacterium]
MLKNILLTICAAVLSAELAARLSGLDYRLLQPLLYYQPSESEVLEVSPNPERLQQLKPNVRSVTTEYKRPVSVNSLGFRGPERSAKKPDGMKRIVCLGGSSVYGWGVGDTETFPFYLEETLNRYYKGRFEVWNGGLCSYVL